MNKPLTIDELKALSVGNWVWVIDNTGDLLYSKSTYVNKVFQCNEKYYECGTRGIGYSLPYSDYGTKWLAYKNKEQAEAKGEIVELPCRCKDCKFYEEAHYESENEEPYIKHVCRLLHRQMQADDFCSYAQARVVELQGEQQ